MSSTAILRMKIEMRGCRKVCLVQVLCLSLVVCLCQSEVALLMRLHTNQASGRYQAHALYTQSRQTQKSGTGGGGPGFESF